MSTTSDSGCNVSRVYYPLPRPCVRRLPSHREHGRRETDRKMWCLSRAYLLIPATRGWLLDQWWRWLTTSEVHATTVYIDLLGVAVDMDDRWALAILIVSDHLLEWANVKFWRVYFVYICGSVAHVSGHSSCRRLRIHWNVIRPCIGGERYRPIFSPRRVGRIELTLITYRPIMGMRRRFGTVAGGNIRLVYAAELSVYFFRLLRDTSGSGLRARVSIVLVSQRQQVLLVFIRTFSSAF